MDAWEIAKGILIAVAVLAAIPIILMVGLGVFLRAILALGDIADWADKGPLQKWVSWLLVWPVVMGTVLLAVFVLIGQVSSLLLAP